MPSAQMQTLVGRFEVALNLLKRERRGRPCSIEQLEARADLMEAPLRAIAKYRARSIDDLVTKARIANWTDDGTPDEKIVDSIVRDLLQLGAVR